MAKTPVRGEVRNFADKSQLKLAEGLSDLVIVELFVGAIAIGFVAAMLAPAQVIVLAGIANKGHW
jgi:hypothetical protein